MPEHPCACPDAGSAAIGDASPPEHPNSKGVIRIGIAEEPSSLVSLVDPGPSARNISDHEIFQTLVALSKDGSAALPELAVSWETSQDLMTYVFHLDSQARWHDGKPVTPDDVVFTFSLLLDPEAEIPVQGAVEDISDVRVEEENTVTITLDRPRPNLLASLASLPVLPQHVYGLVPLAVHPAARAPVGSGPFRFTRWIPGQTIELERNPNWRGEPAFAEKIIYRIVKDERVALELFKQGDLDIVAGLSGRRENAIAGARTVSYALPVFQAWVYNTSKPVFARAESRAAVGMLIDREAIRCSLLGCAADLIESPWPPEFLGASDALSRLRFDPSGAGALLEAAGWADKDGDGVRERGGLGFSFSLLLPDTDRNMQRMAAVVQSDLASAGIEMRIATVSFETYSNSLKAHAFDASIITVSTDAAFDPSPYFHSRSIDGDRNFGLFASPRLDELLDGMRNAQTRQTRMDFAKKIAAALGEERPMTFTFRPHAWAAVKNRVRGVVMRDGWFDERFLWLSEPASGGEP